jgi:hypothetical protein
VCSSVGVKVPSTNLIEYIELNKEYFMQVQCTKCGYMGNISEKLVPNEGRNLKCPKCKEMFFVRKQGPGQGPVDAANRYPARPAEPVAPVVPPAAPPDRDTGVRGSPVKPYENIGGTTPKQPPGVVGAQSPETVYRPPAGPTYAKQVPAGIDNKSILGAIVAGSISAFVCSVIWAVITVLTGWQVGLMAIGVGLFVGIGVGVFAGGEDDLTFGLIGASLSLLGCLFGNLLSICAFVSRGQADISFFTLLFDAIFHPAKLNSLFSAYFSIMDLVFYGIAVSVGFKTATGIEPEKHSDS